MPTLSRIAVIAADHHGGCGGGGDDADNARDHRPDVQHAGESTTTTTTITCKPMQHPANGHKRKPATHSEVEYSVPLKKKNDLVTEGGDLGGNQGSSTQFVVHENYNPNNHHHEGRNFRNNNNGGGDTVDIDLVTSNPTSVQGLGGHSIIRHDQSPHQNKITTTPPSSSSFRFSTSSPPSSLPFTRVDGKGLWRSWKRNFKNKLLALLDLIDNSLDAAIVTATPENNNGNDDDDDDDECESRNRRINFIGRIHIYPDDDGTVQEQGLRPTSVSSSSYFVAAAAATATTSAATIPPPTTTPTTTTAPPSFTKGLCIINNSFRPIRPLVKVLEVYNSSKIHSGAHDIGENGVGLKQGCATLSDLSFVLVKNGQKGFLELGMIAESLQLPEGCYLPSFRFDISEDDEDNNTIESIKSEMMILFSKQEHSDVARCVEQYGSNSVATNSGVSPLERGVNRLCKHFRSILNFYESLFVFAVILDSVAYGDRHYSNGMSSQSADPIKDLRSEIPRTYLHIPAGFDFRIGSSNMNREKLIFDYWPQRLVELSSFTVHVNENIPWHHGDDEVRGYKLRAFAGFDRMRINSPDEVKSASLYVYSRQSGRLIKYEPDARFILGLNASGSMYCSGLTILVDDIGGKLPLNPTKQDIAFGEQDNGYIHKGNLYTWVGAVTRFFYDHHVMKFDQKKKELTEKIKGFGSEIATTRMKEIDRCHLTKFNLQYTFVGEKSIRIKRNPKEIVGRDTHFSLVPDAPAARVSSDEDGSSRRRIDHAQNLPQPQQIHSYHAQGGITASTPVLQASCPPPGTRISQQTPVPVVHQNGGKVNGVLVQKEHEFQALVNRHRDDVFRLMKELATRGESSIPANQITAARNKSLFDMRVANFFVHQSGGTMLLENDLNLVLAKAEQEAVILWKQGLRQVNNIATEKISCGSKEVGDHHEFSDGEGDNCSVASSKSYYKDLCARLTATLEKRNKDNHELRSEITNLKDALGKQEIELKFHLTKAEEAASRIYQSSTKRAAPSNSAITEPPDKRNKDMSAAIKEKEREFEAAVDRHKEDTLRLMRECAKNGRANVSTEDMTAARNMNFIALVNANRSILQAGGKLFVDAELQNRIARAEKEAVAMYIETCTATKGKDSGKEKYQQS